MYAPLYFICMSHCTICYMYMHAARGDHPVGASAPVCNPHETNKVYTITTYYSQNLY